MKRPFLAFVVIAGFASPAFAQDTAALCRLMGAGGPMGNGAAYVPGVDAHGKPVVPADMNAGTGSDADIIKIPLSIDLARRLNVPRGAEMETSAGTIEIHKDGRVTANGMDMTSQSRAICGMPEIAPAAAPEKVAAPAAPVIQPPAPPVVTPPHIAAPAPVPPAPANVGSAPSLLDAAKPADIDPKTYMPRAGSVSADAAAQTAPDVKPNADIKPRDLSQDEAEKPSTRDGLIWGQGN
jgi:hypothetical protein